MQIQEMERLDQMWTSKPNPPLANPEGHLVQRDTFTTRHYSIHQSVRGELEEVKHISIWQFEEWRQGNIQENTYFAFSILNSNDKWEMQDDAHHVLTFGMHESRDSYVLRVETIGRREVTGFPFRIEQTERLPLNEMENWLAKDKDRLEFFTNHFNDWVG